MRQRAGRRLSSPALFANGDHARVDGFVRSPSSPAPFRPLGAQIGESLIGLAVTLVILRITWQSWRTVSTTEPGKMVEPHDH